MSGIVLTIELPEEAVEAIAERVAELLRGELAPSAPRREFVTPVEAAEIWGCDRQRIYDLRSQGRLTRHREGGRAMVSVAELEALIGPPGDEVAARRRAA